MAGVAKKAGLSFLWIGTFRVLQGRDLVVADFSSTPSRLGWYPTGSYDPSTAVIQAGGERIPLMGSQTKTTALVPELSMLDGFWIWDRLGALSAKRLDRAGFLLPLSAALGFLVFAAGIRFMTGLSGWPLANVFLAALGMTTIIFLDALASIPEARILLSTLGSMFGMRVEPGIVLAACEALLGILLTLVDLVAGGGRHA